MSEARRASLQEIDELHREIMELCSEDEDSMVEILGSGGRNANSSVIFVGLSRASPRIIEIEDSIINLISDESIHLDSSANVTSSPKQSTSGQASAEHIINKSSLEKPYSIEEAIGKETIANVDSAVSNTLQTNPSTFTSSTSSVSGDTGKIKQSFKNSGTCMVGKSGANNDRFVVASSTTDINTCTSSKTNICTEYSSTAFTTMTVSKVASDNNLCSLGGGKDVHLEKVLVTEPMISSGNTPMAQTKFRNANFSFSSLDCSPIPRSGWRKTDSMFDASNFTPVPRTNKAMPDCKIVHSTPLGGQLTFPKSSTVSKRSIRPRTIEELCSDMASDISNHTLEYKRDKKNASSQCISGFAALFKGDPCQKPHQTFVGKTIKTNAPLSKINLESLVQENTTIINKKEDEKCRERNKEKICSSPVMGRFKDVSVSRSMSVMEEDIFDMSEDILGLEEDVLTDNEITDEEIENVLLDLDTVHYSSFSRVKEKAVTKRDHLEECRDDEMDQTLVEDTVQAEETMISQEENYDVNTKRRSLLPWVNTEMDIGEIIRFTDWGELDKQADVTNKTVETQFHEDKKNLIFDSRQISSQTVLFTELESGEIVSGIDSCEFDQTTVLATSDKGEFDQVTVLATSDKGEFDQTTILATSDKGEFDQTTVLAISDKGEFDQTTILATSDKGEFDQTTVLTTSDKGEFDQTTTLEKCDKIEYDQTTVQEKAPESDGIGDDDEKDIYNALNFSIDSFELIKSPVITEQKLHYYMLSKKGKKTVKSRRKSVAEEKLTSKICIAKPKAVGSAKPTTPTVLSSEMLIKLRQKRRKRKLEKIMSSGKVLLRDIDPVESQEKKQKKIETKPISEEMKVTKKKTRKKRKQTKVPLEQQSETVGKILLIAAEIMKDQGKVETQIKQANTRKINSQPEETKERAIKNKDTTQGNQKIKKKDVINLDGVKKQQIGSCNKVFVNIDMHSSSRDSAVSTVSDIVLSSAVTLQSLLVPVVQTGNSQAFPTGGEKKTKVVGNKEAPVTKLFSNVAMSRDGKSLPDQNNNIEKKTDFSITKVTVEMNQGSPSTATNKTSSHAYSKEKDENLDKGKSDSAEKKDKATAEEAHATVEIVSLMQEHAALDQNLEGNKLIKQVQKKWKCSVKKTPETNLTTSLHAQRHSNTSKNIESKLQGDRYCTLDIESNLQSGAQAKSTSGSVLDSTKQALQQMATELHALEEQKAAEIAGAAELIDIRLSKLASAHREQIRKLHFQQDFELNYLRKQCCYNPFDLQAIILQIGQEHQNQRTRLKIMMQEEVSALVKEKQAQIAERFDKKINQLKNITEQLRQQDLPSSGSRQGPYVSVELFKAPHRKRKRAVVTVCLPADVAQGLLKEDAVYDHFYSGEWKE